MKYYALFNKVLNKKLSHPKTGLWYTTSLEEANAMLKSCVEYLEAYNLGALKDNFTIIEIKEYDI